MIVLQAIATGIFWLAIGVLAAAGVAHLADYFITERPRKRALNLLRAGQVIRSRATPLRHDVDWRVLDIDYYTGTVLIAIDANTELAMLVPAEILAKQFHLQKPA